VILKMQRGPKMVTQQATKIVNGVDMEILQGTINSMKQQPALAKSKFHIHNKWISGGNSRTTVTEFYSAGKNIAHKQKFTLEADEPPILAGGDKGANPVEHLLNALAACLTGAMVYHAAVHGIHIEELESEVEGNIDLRGFTGLSSSVRKGYQDITVKFKVKTDAENIQKLKDLAEFSPVYDTICNGTSVKLQVEKK
jgi:uncharacterized OsmC-like protein